MRKHTRRLTLMLAALAALVAAATAAATTTVVVAPGHLDGWATNNDTCGAATTGSVSFGSTTSRTRVTSPSSGVWRPTSARPNPTSCCSHSLSNLLLRLSGQTPRLVGSHDHEKRLLN